MTREVLAEFRDQQRATDLLVRYWGLGKPLGNNERDELMALLDAENKSLNGPIHMQALRRMKDAGIY